MSQLAQTASSRSQGAQCIPVKRERAMGRDSSRTLLSCCMGQGTAPNCSVTPPARFPIPNWRPPHHGSHPASLPQDLLSCTWAAWGSPVPQVGGNWSPGLAHPRITGWVGAMLFTWCGQDKRPSKVTALPKPARAAQTAARHRRGGTLGWGSRLRDPQVSLGFWDGTHPTTTALCFPVPSSPNR